MDEINTSREQPVGVEGDQRIYRPTLRSMLGPTLLVSIVSIVLLVAAVKSGRMLPAVLPFIFIGLLIAVHSRLKLIVDKRKIQYIGLLTKKTIVFDEIIHAGWMYEHGFSRDRFFGSLVYEVLSRKERIKINFRLFSVDQMSSLLKRLESLRNMPETPDQFLPRAGTESIESSSAQSTNTKVEK